MAPAAITAPPMRKGFSCSIESVPEAAASAPASVSPSRGGGTSGSGVAGTGSALRGADGSFFSALDAALGAGAVDLALASMDRGVAWAGGDFIRSAQCCFAF